MSKTTRTPNKVRMIGFMALRDKSTDRITSAAQYSLQVALTH